MQPYQIVRDVILIDSQTFVTLPACLRTGGEFWSARCHSESTSVSSAAREPETGPDEAPPPFFSPSFAPTQDRTHHSATRRLPATRVPASHRNRLDSGVFTFSSSVSFSFLSFSLSTAFSSQRRALAFRSLAPPEITPDFWNRVPSRATVCGAETQNRSIY